MVGCNPLREIIPLSHSAQGRWGQTGIGYTYITLWGESGIIIWEELHATIAHCDLVTLIGPQLAWKLNILLCVWQICISRLESSCCLVLKISLLNTLC